MATEHKPLAQGKPSNLAALEAAHAQTQDTTQRLSISHATLVSAITSAALSSKFSLQLELATGLAVYSTFGGTTKEARAELFAVYNESGYDAGSISAPEYKTVHRRLTTTAKLYNYLGADKVAEWGEASNEMLLINTLVRHLEPLNLKSINATLAYVGKPVLKTIEQHTVERKGDYPQQHTVSDKGIPDGRVVEQQTEEQAYAAWLTRRGGTPLEKEWEIKAGFHRVAVAGLEVVIPPETTKDALVALAMALLAEAQDMDGEGQQDTRGGGGSTGEYHEEVEGDNIGNRHPSAPRRIADGNLAVPEAVAPPEADGNKVTAVKPSRYRAAPKLKK